MDDDEGDEEEGVSVAAAAMGGPREEVAAKRMLQVDTAVELRRMDEEVAMIRQLRHPNLVQYLGTASTAGSSVPSVSSVISSLLSVGRQIVPLLLLSFMNISECRPRISLKARLISPIGFCSTTNSSSSSALTD